MTSITDGTMTGVVADTHDHGPTMGVSFTPDDGRELAMVADAADGLLVATIRGALAHGDRVSLRFERLPQRLGAPYGRVTGVRILDYEPAMDHAA